MSFLPQGFLESRCQFKAILISSNIRFSSDIFFWKIPKLTQNSFRVSSCKSFPPCLWFLLMCVKSKLTVILKHGVRIDRFFLMNGESKIIYEESATPGITSSKPAPADLRPPFYSHFLFLSAGYGLTQLNVYLFLSHALIHYLIRALRLVGHFLLFSEFRWGPKVCLFLKITVFARVSGRETGWLGGDCFREKFFS